MHALFVSMTIPSGWFALLLLSRHVNAVFLYVMPLNRWCVLYHDFIMLNEIMRARYYYCWHSLQSCVWPQLSLFHRLNTSPFTHFCLLYWPSPLHCFLPEMHRVFQRDLCKLRLATARSYVKIITEGHGPLAAAGGSLRLNAQVRRPRYWWW